jgi:hypothetical protein
MSIPPPDFPKPVKLSLAQNNWILTEIAPHFLDEWRHKSRMVGFGLWIEFYYAWSLDYNQGFALVGNYRVADRGGRYVGGGYKAPAYWGSWYSVPNLGYNKPEHLLDMLLQAAMQDIANHYEQHYPSLEDARANILAHGGQVCLGYFG